MENPFPILFLTPLAHFLLRLILGFVLIYLALLHTRVRNELTATLEPRLSYFAKPLTVLLIAGEGIIGTLLILGMATQYAALLLFFMTLDMMFLSRWSGHSSLPSRLSYLLMFAMATSLFITGAGAFAVDLPI